MTRELSVTFPEPLPAEHAEPRWIGTAAESTPVSEIMCTRVVCADPRTPISAMARVFLDDGISGAPVLDDDARPIGVLSKSDLLRELAHAVRAHELPERTVDDAMTPVVFAVRQDTSVAQAAALMAYEGVHRLPVVDAEGRIVGLITSLDLVRWLARQKSTSLPELGHS